MAALLLLCAGCSPSAVAPPAPDSAHSAEPSHFAQSTSSADRELLLQAPLEGELSPGQEHIYAIDLVAGEFVHIHIMQLRVDVETTLAGPDGSPILTVDRTIGYEGPEPLLAVASSTGRHTVQIKAANRDRPAGRYRVELLECHPATEIDLLRAEAARFLYPVPNQTKISRADLIGNLTDALGLWREVGNDFWIAETLFLLASYESKQESALDRYQESAALFSKAGDRQRQGDALNSLGNHHYQAGDPETAISFYEQAFSVQAQDGFRLGQAITQSNRGKAYRSMAHYEGARDFYNQALNFLDEGMDRRQRAQFLHDLGVVYRFLGERRKALDHLTAAEIEFGELEDPASRAASLNQLGTLARQGGDAADALEWHQKALGLRQKIKDRRGEVNTLVDIGLVYRVLNQPEKALESYVSAETLLEQLELPRAQAKVWLALGSLYSERNRQNEALKLLRDAVELHNTLGDPAGEAESLFELALAHSRLGDLARARAIAADAIARVEGVRLSARSPAVRISYFSTVQQFFELNIDLLMKSHAADPSAGHDAKALLISERARARSLLELLAEPGVDITQGVDPKLLAREKHLREALTASADRLQSLISDVPNGTGAEALRRFQHEETRELDKIATDLDSVRSEIRAQSPRYAALTQPRPLSLEAIQRQLGSGTRLLEYQLGDQRSYLWSVTSDSLEIFELPARGELDPLIRKTYRQLKISHRPESLRSSRRMLCLLSEALLGPVAGQITNSSAAGASPSQRLVIVADGALQYLPFAALPKPGAQDECGRAQPLLVDHEIVYLPSASVLAALRQEDLTSRPMPGSLAVLADPVFSMKDERALAAATSQPVSSTSSNPLGSSAGPSRLRHSRDEADRILSLVPPQRRFSAFGFAASKDVIMSGELDSYRILHFATHATFDTSRPELSGLSFSRIDPNGKKRGDASLRVHELFNLNLSAELVVLSACNTALGQEVRGEGLVGLTRGFMYAGVPRVVVSLWEVSDQSTSLLMGRFYQGLLNEGLSPGAALRQAQIVMWKQKPAPYYWAPFVLQGEWKPLHQEQ